jgi:hypothetical protein
MVWPRMARCRCVRAARCSHLHEALRLAEAWPQPADTLRPAMVQRAAALRIKSPRVAARDARLSLTGVSSTYPRTSCRSSGLSALSSRNATGTCSARVPRTCALWPTALEGVAGQHAHRADPWAVGSCARTALGCAHAESPPKTCALVTLELCGNIVSLHVSCARARGSRIHAFVVRVRWFVCSSES